MAQLTFLGGTSLYFFELSYRRSLRWPFAMHHILGMLFMAFGCERAPLLGLAVARCLLHPAELASSAACLYLLPLQ